MVTYSLQKNHFEDKVQIKVHAWVYATENNVIYCRALVLLSNVVVGVVAVVGFVGLVGAAAVDAKPSQHLRHHRPGLRRD